MTFTSETAREMNVATWQKRRETGGKYNEPAIRPDGTLRPDTYRDDPETGCRIWLMSCTGGRPGNSTTPQAGVNGRTVHIRRELWQLLRGEPVPDVVGAGCGNTTCVLPEHMIDGMTPYGIGDEAEDYIRFMAGKVAAQVIARRIGISSKTVDDRLAKLGLRGCNPAHHRGALAFAGSDDPIRPDGINDRQWAMFRAAKESTLVKAGEQFGVSRQRVYQNVLRVMAAIDREHSA